MRYGLHTTPFGECLIVLSPRGITDIRFLTGPETSEVLLAQLRLEWPQAQYLADNAATQPYAERIFNPGTSEAGQPLPLLLRGTNFQIKVWEALLRIPFGQLASYDGVARYIGQPTASRAVGTAIGSNRLAYLIPCHRVLQKAGGLGGYRWGTARKQALLGWEAAQSQPEVPWLAGTLAQTHIEF